MKKPRTRAVALNYNGKGAPRVTVKGEGKVAERIIATAKEHNIPLEQNEELTALLCDVRINEEIPRSLYTAVAQILAFIYFINGKKPERN
ncbi:MAG: EscU/YscU/HrcU family type III secretion system export apparatus switch protein [Legionella sp.]|nr:EscU/YscU/HrcU family type III secretion system export apparatus switch protein [Legionella sp.]